LGRRLVEVRAIREPRKPFAKFFRQNGPPAPVACDLGYKAPWRTTEITQHRDSLTLAVC